MEEEAVAPAGDDQPGKFSLPVDGEGKATDFRPFSLAAPHMRAFHLAWLNLFTCFFSTFAIPPLLPVIRRELRLSAADVGHAGIASFAGSIFSRLAMGPACDLLGPRASSAALSLLTAPVVLAAALVDSPASFILVRFLVGFSLANFVSNQFWMSSMFSGNVVGVANGVAAGWANVGAGATQLLMPLIYSFITRHLYIPPSAAWRLAFVVPATLQAVTGVLVLAFGQDTPSMLNHKTDKIRKLRKQNVLETLLRGIRDYRGWVLALTYGFCFGVELTVDNVIAGYFYDRFGVELEVAGAIAASFGMANFVSRPAGGMLSDALARRFGMRGRLWGLWSVQLVAALLCVSLGRVNSLWASVAVMCCFSFFVQAASGLTFGVVPFVSKRSLGVISGMTGSGGTVGAVVTQLLLFSGPMFTTQTSISLMGLMMLGSTIPITFMHFPQSGSMFCGPSQPHDPPEHQPLLQ